MEYNTQRQTLKITDYGRTVCKLIEYCKSMPDRNERTQMAHTIVEAMALVNPKAKEKTDYRRTLWDHLMMMANYELDVDAPFPIMPKEQVEMKPNRLERPTGKIRFPHYGRSLEQMVRAVADMPAGDERDRVMALVAHAMKRQYLQWNRDSVDDQLIKDQFAILTEGRLRLPDDFQFLDTQSYLDDMAAAAAKKEAAAKKKKKKKKKKA